MIAWYIERRKHIISTFGSHILQYIFLSTTHIISMVPHMLEQIYFHRHDSGLSIVVDCRKGSRSRKTLLLKRIQFNSITNEMIQSTVETAQFEHLQRISNHMVRKDKLTQQTFFKMNRLIRLSDHPSCCLYHHKNLQLSKMLSFTK